MAILIVLHDIRHVPYIGSPGGFLFIQLLALGVHLVRLLTLIMSWTKFPYVRARQPQPLNSYGDL